MVSSNNQRKLPGNNQNLETSKKKSEPSEGPFKVVNFGKTKKASCEFLF